MDKFVSKDPLEIIPLDFDFTALLDGQKISGVPTVAVTVYTGTDASPASILSGSVVVTGDRARQNVTGGLADVEYLVRVTVTTNAGLKHTIGRVLPVKLSGTY